LLFLGFLCKRQAILKTVLFCVLLLVVFGFGSIASAAQTSSPTTSTEQQSDTQIQKGGASEPRNPETPAGVNATAVTKSEVSAPKKQPKRILGIMPNYRAVSAGELPPPPTPKQSFKLAAQNSFDYSSFVFVGITSLIAEGTDAHPKLGKGVEGFGNYYWRGFVDKTDGNFLVIFAYPTIFHQDERYYAMGKGSFMKRTAYAASRVLITPGYSGHNTFNASELLGRATAQGISTTYYPASDSTFGAVATRFGYAVGRDALTNVFREWWPDIAAHVFHQKN